MLILASPTLRDRHFARSVLLLTEHHAEHGAHGFVLNRPSNQTVGDLLPGEEFEDLKDVPVCIGGPVGPGELTFASLRWLPDEKRLEYHTHLKIGEAARRLRAGETVRAFAGYSGWAAGQLENELRHQSWITLKPRGNPLEAGDAKTMWTNLLEQMGPAYRLIARFPEDPSLN